MQDTCIGGAGKAFNSDFLPTICHFYLRWHHVRWQTLVTNKPAVSNNWTPTVLQFHLFPHYDGSLSGQRGSWDQKRGGARKAWGEQEQSFKSSLFCLNLLELYLFYWWSDNRRRRNPFQQRALEKEVVEPNDKISWTLCLVSGTYLGNCLVNIVSLSFSWHYIMRLWRTLKEYGRGEET